MEGEIYIFCDCGDLIPWSPLAPSSIPCLYSAVLNYLLFNKYVQGVFVTGGFDNIVGATQIMGRANTITKIRHALNSRIKILCNNGCLKSETHGPNVVVSLEMLWDLYCSFFWLEYVFSNYEIVCHIGFKSGDWLGQWRMSLFFPLGNSWEAFALCFGLNQSTEYSPVHFRIPLDTFINSQVIKKKWVLFSSLYKYFTMDRWSFMTFAVASLNLVMFQTTLLHHSQCFLLSLK